MSSNEAKLTRYQKYKKTYQAYAQSHRDQINRGQRERYKLNPRRYKTKKYMDYQREYQRNWNKRHPLQRKEMQRKYKREHPEKQREYASRYPEKVKAHSIANNLKIPLEPECFLCGSTENLEKHHPNYSKPKLVQTVCKQCHTLIHTNVQEMNQP